MTYVPSQSDIEWTLNNINGKIMWSVPSVGCVILLHHQSNSWITYMKSNPTEQETDDYEKIEANLNILGYHESSASIIGEANNVNDVLVILKTIIAKAEQKKELDEFWNGVKILVSHQLDELGL